MAASPDRSILRSMLRTACDRSGSAAAFARSHGISAAYVSEVLRGSRDPGPSILKALGVERVVSYRAAGEGEVAA